MMKRDAMRDHMVDIIARLEKESPIVILPGAEEEVARVVADVVKAAATTGAASK
jgi:GGDEF domain-containing protein